MTPDQRLEVRWLAEFRADARFRPDRGALRQKTPRGNAPDESCDPICEDENENDFELNVPDKFNQAQHHLVISVKFYLGGK